MRFIWPLEDPIITRHFGYHSSIYVGGMHAALDFGAPTGTPIRAVASGTVHGDSWDTYSGYYIAIQHADNWRSTYRHLRTDAPPSVGQLVAQGQVIGEVGSTGYSTGPHLHFDLWNTTKRDPTALYKHGIWAHDPELYLAKEDDDMDRAQFDEWWMENWGKYVGDPPTPSLPSSHIIRYLRAHTKLQEAVSGAAVNGGEVTKAINAAVRNHAQTPHSGGTA
jgi:hypothetical protein